MRQRASEGVTWANRSAGGSGRWNVALPIQPEPVRQAWDSGRLPIRVKGHAQVGAVELSANEWAKACNLRDGYWLYVVYACASAALQLLRLQNPLGVLTTRAKGAVILDQTQIQQAAQTEEARQHSSSD